MKISILGMSNVIILFYFIALTSCNYKYEPDLKCTINEEIDSYRLSASIIQFYLEVDYINLNSKKNQYTYDFNTYDKILKNLNQFKNEVVNSLEEGRKTEIYEKTSVFINNCIEYSEKDKEIIFLIKKLKIIELSLNIDKYYSKKDFLKRKVNAYKLLLNSTLVTQLMIDKLTHRRILIYPFRE